MNSSKPSSESLMLELHFGRSKNKHQTVSCITTTINANTIAVEKNSLHHHNPKHQNKHQKKNKPRTQTPRFIKYGDPLPSASNSIQTFVYVHAHFPPVFSLQGKGMSEIIRLTLSK